MSEVPISEDLAKRFRVLAALGEMAHGHVYRVEEVADARGKPLVLTVVRRDLSEDPVFRQAFLDDLRVFEGVASKYVIRVCDVGTTAEGLLYFVTRDYSGDTLATVQQDVGRLDVERALKMGRRVLSALALSHDVGVVHGHIRPANILLPHTEQGETTRILNFGFANAPVTDAGVADKGSFAYCDRRRLLGQTAEFSSDIYSVGAVLYTALVGRTPFPGETPEAVLGSMESQQSADAAPLRRALDGHAGHSAAADAILHALTVRPTAVPSARKFMNALGAAFVARRRAAESSGATTPDAPVALNQRPSTLRRRTRKSEMVAAGISILLLVSMAGFLLVPMLLPDRRTDQGTKGPKEGAPPIRQAANPAPGDGRRDEPVADLAKSAPPALPPAPVTTRPGFEGSSRPRSEVADVPPRVGASGGGEGIDAHLLPGVEPRDVARAREPEEPLKTEVAPELPEFPGVAPVPSSFPNGELEGPEGAEGTEVSGGAPPQTVASAVAAAPKVTSLSELPELSVDSALALLQLGQRFEDLDQSGRAKQIYRRILTDAPDSTARSKAVSHLYRMEGGELRSQERDVEQAERYHDENKLESAQKHYEKAYQKAKERRLVHPSAVTPDELLLRLEKVQESLDIARSLPRRASEPLPCRKCATPVFVQKKAKRVNTREERLRSDGGFVVCDSCDGVGFKLEPRKIGTVSVRVWVTCTTCKKIGHLFCPRCLGLEFFFHQMSAAHRAAYSKLLGTIREFPNISGKKSFARVLKKVEDTLVSAKDSSTLSFLRAIEEPKFTLSRHLWNSVDSIPLSADSVRAVEWRWNRVPPPLEEPDEVVRPIDPRRGRRSRYPTRPDERKAKEQERWSRVLRMRANFLLGYAVKYAAYLRHFDLLRGAPKRLDFAQPPSAGVIPRRLVQPGLLAAYPTRYRSGWVSVVGRFKGYEKRTYKGRVELEGEHRTRFFTWLSKTRGDLKRLERSLHAPRNNGLHKHFPYTQVAGRLAVLQPGQQVVLVGRFLRDRWGSHRNWFEVWDVAPCLAPAQEAILSNLDAYIDVSFSDAPTPRFLEFLASWYGIPVSYPGVNDTLRLTGRMQRVAVVWLIDELARALGVQWALGPQGILFAESFTEAELRAKRLALLQIEASPSQREKVKVEVARPRGGSGKE